MGGVLGDIDGLEERGGEEAGDFAGREFHGRERTAEVGTEAQFGAAESAFDGTRIGGEEGSGMETGGGPEEDQSRGAGIEDEIAGLAVDGRREAGAAFGVAEGEADGAGGGRAVQNDLAAGEVEEVAVAAEPGLTENAIGVRVADRGEGHFDGVGFGGAGSDADGTGGEKSGTGGGDLLDAVGGDGPDGAGNGGAEGGGGGAGIDDHAEGALAVQEDIGEQEEVGDFAGGEDLRRGQAGRNEEQEEAECGTHEGSVGGGGLPSPDEEVMIL